LLKKLVQSKLVWLAAVVLSLTLIAAWIGLRSVETQRQDQAEEAAMAHRQFEIAVQNALGFKRSSVSEMEFPGIKGIFVNSLMSDDSAAALAHIQAGDVLLELNGQVVRNDSELERVLNSLQTGAEVPVKIYREGEIIDSRIRIADRNFPPLMSKVEARDQGFLGVKKSGRRCCIPGSKKWGIEVSELHDNGPADLFGVKVGDVITEFNGLPTRTTSEFNRHIRAVKPRSKVVLKFLRGNTEQTVEVLMGHRWEDSRWR
jgi:S1-C subfamily serine protease